jgi:3-hydroxyisobutyrate dehydrogenase
MSDGRRIAFFGLGHMGLPMATNLVEAGWSVRGFDPQPEAAQAATSAGVDIASTPGDAGEGADVVITMLASGAQVLDCYQPEGHLLDVIGPDALVVDCSTIDIADARQLHAMVADTGRPCLDAPVSGGGVGAAAATLTFMVGGGDIAYELASPVLSSMGTRLVHCGEAGAGQAAKLCNNMILAVSMIAVSEAFVLGESLGLSHQSLFDVTSAASAQCWALTTNCPVPGPVPTSPANFDYRPGFATSLMVKDLRLAEAAAELTGVDAVLGRQATRIYEALGAEPGDLDFSAVINTIRSHSTTKGPSHA